MRVLLLISDGSWLVLRTAEKATLEFAARTDIPRGDDDDPLESVAGFESHTTRHLPSRTIGSVSFCAQTGSTRISRTAGTTDSARRAEPMVSRVRKRQPGSSAPWRAAPATPGSGSSGRCHWLDRQRLQEQRRRRQQRRAHFHQFSGLKSPFELAGWLCYLCPLRSSCRTPTLTPPPQISFA